MATKKKTAVSIENLATKSVGDLNTDLAKLQTQIREALGTVGEALLQKCTELEGLQRTILEKSEELSELHGKEKIANSLEELKVQLEDAKREHARNLRILKVDYEDKEKEFRRQQEEAAKKAAIAQEEVSRKRKIDLEDQDRERQLKFDARAKELEDQAQEVAKQLLELGAFEDRVKKEVERRASAIKRDLEFGYHSKLSDAAAAKKVLDIQVERLEQDKQDLQKRISSLDDAVAAAQARAAAIATSALDKDAGKAALDELRSVAHKQAEGKK